MPGTRAPFAVAVAAAAAALALVLAPSLAYPCSEDGRATAAPPDIFALADQASAIAEVVVTSAPGFTVEGHGKPGDVTLAVRATLAGKLGKTITYRQRSTFCGGESKGGGARIVFLDAGKKPLAFAAITVKDALVKWRAAKSDDDKATLLAAFARDKDPYLAAAATAHLASRPPPWASRPASWTSSKSSKTSAIAQVKRAWPAIAKAAPSLDRFTEDLASGACKLDAHKSTGSKEATQIKDTLAKTEDIQLGTLAALSAAPNIWVTWCSRGFFSVHVYVDAKDGHVIGAWSPPEG